MKIQTVKIGGREFPVPPLSLRSLAVVVPGIMTLEGLPPSDVLKEPHFSKILDIVWQGVAAGTPGFTRSQFDDLPGTPKQLMDALTVVTAQTGMTGEGEAASGEATPASQQTGTGLSA